MTPDELEILEALEGETEPVEYADLLAACSHPIYSAATIDRLETGGFIHQEPIIYYSLTRAGHEVLALRRKQKEIQEYVGDFDPVAHDICGSLQGDRWVAAHVRAILETTP